MPVVLVGLVVEVVAGWQMMMMIVDMVQVEG